MERGCFHISYRICICASLQKRLDIITSINERSYMNRLIAVRVIMRTSINSNIIHHIERWFTFLDVFENVV